MLVSFVIPAHNEEPLLAANVAAIHAAAAACAIEYEIIVADDASTDRTAHVAADSGARVVSVQHRQIAATRNSGARASHGEILVFVDADTLINEDVLRAALDAVARGAVGGGAAVRFDGAVPLYASVLTPWHDGDDAMDAAGSGMLRVLHAVRVRGRRWLRRAVVRSRRDRAQRCAEEDRPLRDPA